MGDSTHIDARKAQGVAIATHGSTATSTGNASVQGNLEPAAATQVAALLGELLVLLKGLDVPAGTRPKLNETAATVQEAKDVATSPAPDKEKLGTTWAKARGWITSALDVGLFVEGAAAKVKDLAERVGGLLG